MTVIPAAEISPIRYSQQQPQRPSRDEMNLAEFPLTVLSTRPDSKTKTLEFSDVVRHRNGETVTRKWIITGADKFGLPTSSDDEVLLGLLKLTVDDCFKDRKVYFTRYELLTALRWTTEGRNYSRLQKALDRLSGVRIKATNAFYDNEAKSHSTRNFGLIDAYELNDGRDANRKPSFFIWSEVLFKSFQVGFIKKLDLDFYLSLKSAVSKRLYRYLDKHFWYKAKLQHNIFMLAHEKIGVSRNYVFASSIRQQLDPALDELLERGFIRGYEYSGKGRGTEVEIHANSSGSRRPNIENKATNVPVESKPEVQNTFDESAQLKETLTEALVERGVRREQAMKLISIKPQNELPRVREIILHFDKLLAAKSHLVSRSPVGFLYRAVEKSASFVLPGDGLKQQKSRVGGTPAFLQNATPQSFGGSDAKATKSFGGAFKEESLSSEYLLARKREGSRRLSETEPQLISKLRKEVQGGLQRLKGLISETRFLEAVEHGVEEKLLKLFAFPDFEEWAERRTEN